LGWAEPVDLDQEKFARATPPPERRFRSPDALVATAPVAGRIGLPRSGARTKLAGMIEVTCDESGYEGEKLIGTTTDVFAHAALRMDLAAATDCLAELRARIRSPATEYKANHILRDKHREVLAWFLDPAGPVYGRAAVYLVDKSYFLVGKLVEALAGDDAALLPGLRHSPAAGAATALLHRGGPRAFPAGPWRAFLVAANDLLRIKERPDAADPVDVFGEALAKLRAIEAPAPLAGLLAQFARAEPHARAYRRRLLADPAGIPPLDLLFPAIEAAVAYWGADGTPVAVAHDRQKTLSEERVARLAARCGPDRLARLTFEVGWDPRVQVTDIVAGAVRSVATDLLHGTTTRFTPLLPPFVDPHSIWPEGHGLGAQRQ
jgi:hypothetical protein